MQQIRYNKYLFFVKSVRNIVSRLERISYCLLLCLLASTLARGYV